MASVIVFDDGVQALAAMTDLRAAFEVRTGALTTFERQTAVLTLAGAPPTGIAVPEAMRALVGEHLATPVITPRTLTGRGQVTLINGRCPLLPDQALQIEPSTALIERSSGQVIAASLAAEAAAAFLETGVLPDKISRIDHDAPALIHFPWDVIRFRDACLDFDLSVLMTGARQELPAGVIAVSDENIRISPDALLYPSVVLDACDGPIVIDDHATIRPGAIIVGPAYIGQGSTVLDRTLIKGHTAIGPVCKVAGEVGGTIFQGLANKSHDGHLGDSWVGSWANLGAGTTNSNLLNTYDQVIAQHAPNATRTRTGLQFLGAIFGDHVKTAIMTRVMTGSAFGTGSMLAALTPPTTVGRFEWVTDGAGQVNRQPYRFEKFMEVARAAMSRRKITPSATYTARLRELSAG